MEILSTKTFAKSLNELTFTDYYYRLMLLARSVYKWENLPNGMDEKWIERFLFREGKCMFFHDKEKGLMISQCAESNEMNLYEEPTQLTPFGIGYSGKPMEVGKECILIRNNDDMVPTSFTLKLFAYRLAEISRAIDLNINAQKTPTLLTGSEKQRLTLKNVYKQWDGNEPVIFGDKSLEGSELLKVLKTDAPVVFPQLQVQKQSVWNECLTFLGINNANTEKKERLITDEAQANNVHIDLSAECFLKARQKACDDINSLFGTDIRVSRREVGELECMENTPHILEH